MKNTDLLRKGFAVAVIAGLAWTGAAHAGDKPSAMPSTSDSSTSSTASPSTPSTLDRSDSATPSTGSTPSTLDRPGSMPSTADKPDWKSPSTADRPGTTPSTADKQDWKSPSTLERSAGSQAGDMKDVAGQIQRVEGDRITLADGTELMLSDSLQVQREQLKEGAKVKASYEERAGQKFVTSIEVDSESK